MKPWCGSSRAHFRLAPSPSRTSIVFRTRMKRLGAFCKAMPALCSRNTKLAAEPSSTGTSSAVMSIATLSRPRPAQADSRCSMVCTLGAPGSPPRLMVEAMRVSHTACGLTGIVTGCGRSVRRKTMPLSARRRAQRQLDALAAVHTHADGAGEGLQGALLQHGRDCPAGRKDPHPSPLPQAGEGATHGALSRVRERVGVRAGGRLNRPACAGTPGSRSRPCRCWPARRPWLRPACGRAARRSGVESWL